MATDMEKGNEEGLRQVRMEEPEKMSIGRYDI